jgi:hypothetical protein
MERGYPYVYSLTYVADETRLHFDNTVTPVSLMNPIPAQTHDSKEASAVKCGMLELMDDAEIDRLRKAICRSFNSSPHKKKYWLALLEMRVAAEKTGHPRVRTPSEESPVPAG